MIERVTKALQQQYLDVITFVHHHGLLPHYPTGISHFKIASRWLGG